ncbi:MAG: hypothetical protein ACOC32_03640 [Nanoarchaeota archaeon]
MEAVTLSEATKILSLLSKDIFSSGRASSKNEKVKKSDERISENPPGFRFNFDERFEELKHVAEDVEHLKESDFPSVDERHTKLKHIEQKVKTEEYQEKMQLEKLEAMLHQLLDTYHELALHHEDKEKLEKIRSRIHDCRRKIQMMKKK